MASLPVRFDTQGFQPLVCCLTGLRVCSKLEGFVDRKPAPLSLSPKCAPKLMRLRREQILHADGG